MATCKQKRRTPRGGLCLGAHKNGPTKTTATRAQKQKSANGMHASSSVKKPDKMGRAPPQRKQVPVRNETARTTLAASKAPPRSYLGPRICHTRHNLSRYGYPGAHQTQVAKAMKPCFMHETKEGGGGGLEEGACQQPLTRHRSAHTYIRTHQITYEHNGI